MDGLATAAANTNTISLIIPCWNDAAALRECLRAVGELRGVDEVIVADASNQDDSLAVAQAAGARIIRCEQPNRGRQLNAGSSLAKGDLLVFQHVDVEIKQSHIDALRDAAARDGIVGGAFHRVFDPSHRLRHWMRPFVRFYNRHIGALYGDQTIFVRREQFQRMGGFRDIPLMEDVEFSRRMRKAGPIALLDPPVHASARRHKQLGSLRVTLFNMFIMVMFRFGVSPSTLHRWYYGGRSAGTANVRAGGDEAKPSAAR
ncbi:MAG TPA: TIGR04283 family arsenosugar biosynthesis glycosyltransferase [Tepidisphaeraceae bacterium]|jgi:rSAM/selenodomain-associated transferase 2